MVNVGEDEPRAKFGLAAGLAALVLAADQASKHWVLETMRLAEVGKVEVSALFDLTFVRNFGVSFGLLKAGSELERWLLVGLSGTISLIFIFWMRTAFRRLTATALGLVVGGALGNMIDRIRFGYVVDFFDFSAMYFPYVFNVADAAISIGAALLVLDFVLNGEADRPKSAVKSG